MKSTNSFSYTIINAIIMIIISFWLLPGNSMDVAASGNADPNWYSQYNYDLDEETHEISIYKYIGKAEEIRIPSEAVIDGKTYATVVEGFNVESAVKSIKFERGVKIADGVTFSSAKSLEAFGFAGADTSRMTTMKSMFSGCENLKTIDFTGVDTSKVTNMDYMFSACTSIESLDLRAFDTTSLKTFALMFNNCRNLKELNLSTFDLTNASGRQNGYWQATDGCNRLEKIWTPTGLKDATYYKWTLPNRPWKYVDGSGNSYTRMPYGDDGVTSKLITISRIGPLSKYTYSLTKENNPQNNKITITSYLGDGGDVEIPSSFTIDDDTYYTCIGDYCYISGVRKLSFQRGVTITKDWTFTKSEFEEIDFTGVNNRIIQGMQHFLSYNKKLKKITWGDFDIKGYPGNPVKSSEYMVAFCPNLKEFDFSSFDISNFVEISNLCSGCTGLELVNFSGVDFSNLRIDDAIFTNIGLKDCKNLKYIYAPINVPAAGKYQLPGTFVDEDGNEYDYLPANLTESILLYSEDNSEEAEAILNPPDDTTWQNDFTYSLKSYGVGRNTKKAISLTKYKGPAVTNLVIPSMATINGVDYVTEIANRCQITNVKKLSFERGVSITGSHTFTRCDFEEIDLTGVSYEIISCSQHLLSYNESLKKITWGDFDIKGKASNPVTGIECLVLSCPNLKELNLKGLDFSSMTYMYAMCEGCKSLETLDLSGCSFKSFNSKHISGQDIGIRGCNSIKYIYAPIDVPADMNLYLPGVYVDKDGNEYRFFPTGLRKSIKLTRIDVADWLKDEEEDLTGSLQTVKNVKYEVQSGDAVSVKGAGTKTKSVVIPDSVVIDGKTYKVTKIESSAYKKNKKLTKVSIGSNVEKIGKNAFNGCKNLGKITINGKNLKSVGSGSFKGIKKGAKITIVCKNKKTYNRIVRKLKSAGAKEAVFKYKKG
ncbi:leucine-rich repeat protein [Butyrivibrio sp. AE3006]|uniref:leucine-rich repeat protein n=1 Tax=Butyrivibrio sp. AE3006 TaxID=1280673 RepID=UPI0004159D1F|nr:leucine-rich repeat protein [Butyrivibrio sp. AE3006]